MQEKKVATQEELDNQAEVVKYEVEKQEEEEEEAEQEEEEEEEAEQ